MAAQNVYSVYSWNGCPDRAAIDAISNPVATDEASAQPPAHHAIGRQGLSGPVGATSAKAPSTGNRHPWAREGSGAWRCVRVDAEPIEDRKADTRDARVT